MRERDTAERPKTNRAAAGKPRADGTSRQAEMLKLQRTAGNRAVGALLRAQQPRRVLARYEPGEHIQFGASGSTVPLAGLSGIDERYLIAMGDFYKSPEALMDAKPDEIKELIKLIDQDENARTGKGGKSPSEDDWQNWSVKWRPKKQQYMELNKVNSAHFAPRNKARWEELHKQALKEAQSSGNGTGSVSAKARIVNGFAAHFLTDAFAAGHMIDKVAVMEAARRSIKTGTNRADLADAIARGILATPACTARLAGRQIKSKALGGSWGTPDQARMASLLDSVMWWKEDDFLSIFARVAHDDLNEAIGRGSGVWVSNKAGDRWQLSGDTTLNKSSKTLDIARKAVRASQDNLAAAAGIKSPGFPQSMWTSALDDAAIQKMFDNVWQYVPEPTTTSQTGEGTQTGSAQVAAAVTQYTNAANPDTVRAIVKLSIDQFDTAIAQLEENKLIRNDPAGGPPAPAAPAPPTPAAAPPAPPAAPAAPVPAVGPKAQLGSPRFMGTDGHTPDATLEAVYEDRGRLHGGSPKSAVKKVQQALLDIGGYDLGPTGADGIYGNYTATAIKLFKHNEHLGSEELGDVGPATINRLDDMFAAKTP